MLLLASFLPALTVNTVLFHSLPCQLPVYSYTAELKTSVVEQAVRPLDLRPKDRQPVGQQRDRERTLIV